MPAWMSLKYAPVRSPLSSFALASSSHLLSEFIIVTGDTPLTERVTSAAAALRIWITVCISPPGSTRTVGEMHRGRRRRCRRRGHVVTVVDQEDHRTRSCRRSRGCSSTWNPARCRRARRVQDRPSGAVRIFITDTVASRRAGEWTREPTLSSIVADSR
jgi:hypothetical protein